MGGARVAWMVAATWATGWAMYSPERVFSNAGEFEASVLGRDEAVWVISFFTSEGCEACSAVAGELASAAEEVSQTLGVRWGAVDVSSGAGRKIGKRLGVGRVPTIGAFSGESRPNPYTNKADRAMSVWAEFDPSGFSASGFKRWVAKQFPSDAVRRVSSADELLEASLPVAALVTERATTSALAKSLGMALRGRLRLVEVADAALGARLASEAPALVALDAYGAPSATFDGSLKDRDAILAWLERHALAERRRPPEEAAPKETSPWGEELAPAAAATLEEAERLADAEEAAVVVGPAGADPTPEVLGKLLALDGAGAVKAVTCADCGETWRAYGFGQGAKRLLGEFDDAKAAFDAAAATVPGDDVQVIGGGAIDAFMQSAVAAADAPPVGVVVFSLREEVAVGVRAFARLLARTTGVTVAQYVVDKADPNDQAVLDRFQVPRAPAVVAFHAAPGSADDPRELQLGLAHFDRKTFGPPAFNSLTAFLELLLRQLAPGDADALKDAYLDEAAVPRRRADRASTSSSRSSATNDSGKKTAAGLLADLTTDFEATCDAQLCAIFLLDRAGRPEAFEDELAVAKAVALAESSAPYRFGWLDAACHPDFAQAFDIDATKLPTLVAYAPKKARFAPYVGKFDPKDLRAFLRAVVSGRLGTGPLRAPLLPPEPRDCASPPDAPAPDDASLDDDLMAEILAEEAANKRRLDQEAEAERLRLLDEQRAAQQDSPPKKKKKKKSSKKKPSPTDL